MQPLDMTGKRKMLPVGSYIILFWLSMAQRPGSSVLSSASLSMQWKRLRSMSALLQCHSHCAWTDLVVVHSVCHCRAFCDSRMLALLSYKGDGIFILVLTCAAEIQCII